MTLDEAIARARAIDRMLATGEIALPYPEDVKRDILTCGKVIMNYADTSEKAKEVVKRLRAPERSQQRKLPW